VVAAYKTATASAADKPMLTVGDYRKIVARTKDTKSPAAIMYFAGMCGCGLDGSYLDENTHQAHALSAAADMH